MTKEAILKLTLYSERLHAMTDVNVLFPYEYLSDGKKEIRTHACGALQVLYLIHGGTDDYSCWVNNTMLPVFAERYPGLLIVMPTVYDFHSMDPEEDYYAYVSQELPEMIERIFPVSCAREDRFIAGLSMGGYFSWRIALSKPERYQCIGSFSSPLDIAEDMRIRHAGATDYPTPEQIKGDINRDLFAMVEDIQLKHKEMPHIFQTCGTEDMTYPLNDRMRRFLDEKGIRHSYMEWSGSHNWKFWNESAEKFLEWLPLRDMTEENDSRTTSLNVCDLPDSEICSDKCDKCNGAKDSRAIQIQIRFKGYRMMSLEMALPQTRAKEYDVLWILTDFGERSNDRLCIDRLKKHGNGHSWYVICIDEGRHDYRNHPTEDHAEWEDFVTVYLWGLLHQMFPELPFESEHNYIAGIGYGSESAARLQRDHLDQFISLL